VVNIANEEWQREPGLDLRALYDRLMRRRWWIIACWVCFMAASLAAAFVITPVYRATVVLASASAERNTESSSLTSALGQLGSLASLAGINVGNNDAATEEALAVFRSRQLTERFISEKNLMPELFASKWDAKNGRWAVDEKHQPTPAKAYRYFDKNVRTIAKDKKTGLVTLQVEWRDRKEAAAWANELVQRLNAEMRDRAIAKADASLGYLEKELVRTPEVGMREAIYRLIEGQVRQRMLADVTEEYAFRVVDRAMAPDADDPAWPPRKAVLLAAGSFLGLMAGMVLAIISTAVPPRADGSASCRQ
jgi:uncharacterized protein involved in exopolysaccharide biosynthesis